MAQTVSVIVSAEERVRLAAIVGDRSRPLKHVQRARIVLHSADRLPVLEVAHRASVSRPAVWRWQRRYAEEGVEPLKPGKCGTMTHDYKRHGTTTLFRLQRARRRGARSLHAEAYPSRVH